MPPPYYPYSGQAVINSQGAKIGAHSIITICPITSTGTPCSPVANIFSDQQGVNGPYPNPFPADENGNFTFFAEPGVYLINVFFGTINYAYPITIGGVGAIPTGQPYDVPTFFPGAPGANVTMIRAVFVRTVTFPVNLAGSQGSSGVAATASTAISIRKNNVEFSKATFAAAANTCTFSTSSSTVFSAADVLTLIAPATPDASLADIALTVTGTR